MTEKRFTLGDYNQNHCEVYDDEEYIGNVKTDDAEMFVDLLNELHEENEQLKKELKNLRRLANELYMKGSE